LENAVRPLTERRKKRKKNKSTFTSDNTSQSSSVHQTIKSAPTDNRQNCWSRNDARSKSPKRKKIEDRSGMIIVALVDYDEISLVSVSPTNEFQQFSSDNFLQDKPLSLIDGNYKSKSKCKKLRKDRSHSSYAPSHNNGKARGNVEYEECVLLKGLTSFTKKVFRIEKKEELFEPSLQRNINAYQGPAWPVHQDAACHEQQKWQFDAHPRQRMRSRVFSFNEDTLSKQMDRNVAASATDFESTFDSLHTNSQDEKVVFQEEEGKGSMARNPLTTKAMEAWKASGPTNEDITKSNAFDSLYTHLQIVQDGAGKERKVDASPMVFQEEQESEGDMNSQTPEALCTTKLMEVWKASGPSNADDMSSIVDAFGTGARGLNAPNTHSMTRKGIQ
jgi:hypothetical protein